MKKQAFVKQEN